MQLSVLTLLIAAATAAQVSVNQLADGHVQLQSQQGHAVLQVDMQQRHAANDDLMCFRLAVDYVKHNMTNTTGDCEFDWRLCSVLEFEPADIDVGYQKSDTIVKSIGFSSLTWNAFEVMEQSEGGHTYWTIVAEDVTNMVEIRTRIATGSISSQPVLDPDYVKVDFFLRNWDWDGNETALALLSFVDSQHSIIGEPKNANGLRSVTMGTSQCEMKWDKKAMVGTDSDVDVIDFVDNEGFGNKDYYFTFASVNHGDAEIVWDPWLGHPSGSSGSSSTSAAAVIGILVLIILAAVGGFCFYKRCCRKKGASHSIIPGNVKNKKEYDSM